MSQKTKKEEFEKTMCPFVQFERVEVEKCVELKKVNLMMSSLVVSVSGKNFFRKFFTKSYGLFIKNTRTDSLGVHSVHR